MKKILILADGEVAWEFIDIINDSFTDTNLYDIVYYDNGFAPKNDSIHCRFYHFDPTSLKKLESVFGKEHILVFIVMEKAVDQVECYKNIRMLSKDVQINLIKFENSQFDMGDGDEALLVTNAVELLANRMINLLPNIPIAAQHVGLGSGEIIEVKVPFGSSYAYRHISNIEQKKWRVAALYRSRDLMLPKPNLMIRPNDSLLLIGQPSILKNVYKAITIETGQFPSPYGANIYLLLDASRDRQDSAIQEIETALLLHRRIKNKKLFIKAIHPDAFVVLDKLRSINSNDIIVDIVYMEFNIKNELVSEISRLNIGLVIVSRQFFAVQEHRELLHKSKKAVLKIGEEGIKGVKQAVLMLSKNRALENISSTMFDLSGQLSLIMNLYHASDSEDEYAQIVEHYENLADIHSRKIEVRKIQSNVVLAIKKESGVLLFLPFDKSLVHKGIMDLFKINNIEKFYHMLDRHSQIFIPVL